MDLTKWVNSSRYIFSVSAIYIAALFAFFVLTPHSFMLGEYQVPPSKTYMLPANSGVVPNRFVANPTDRLMSSQFETRNDQSHRFHFKFNADWPVSGARALYIPSSGGETRVFINGSPAPVSEVMPLFAPGLGTHLLSYKVPRGQLIPGTNRLDIHVQKDEVRSGIRGVFLAPIEQVEVVTTQQRNWLTLLPIVITIGSSIVILICLGGVIIGQKKVWYMLLGSLGILLFFQAAMSFLLEIEPFKSHLLTLRFVFPIAILALLISLRMIDQRGWTRPNYIKPALYILAITGPLLGLMVMLSPFLIPYPLQSATLAIAGPLPLLLVTGLIDFKQDLTVRRSQLAALSMKVSEQAEELDEKGRIIAREMQNRAVLEERQRFSRDIHDGIGGQLLSLLLRVRTGNLKVEHIAEELQAGLNDLRLVVDSMDHTGDDLVAALATFRARANKQLRAADIDLSWEQSDPLFLRFRTTRATLDVYRVMQEALTNIVKHAQARHVEITINQPQKNSPLILRVSDDGVGLPSKAKEGPGKGLSNLYARANRLNATLEFRDGIEGKGTTVEIIIPASD